MSQQHSDELRRELGFWDALTIGVGTMVGAGIFLLAGPALDQAGPAAIFAYVLAGLVCVATAANAAELATGMPTSGGAYYFVSRALGPALGAICGVGIWLSLTVAIAFYLFGMGEFIATFTPLPTLLSAALGGVGLTVINVIGARQSGRTQVIVVVALIVILTGFSVLGMFHVSPARYEPFFPFGTGAIMPVTALVFISFLGFVQIASVAEEIEDPDRNLPRTLIGSVAVVTAIYLIIVLVIAGVFEQGTIAAVADPLTSAARFMIGGPGAAAIIVAGLLATLSSANASILASSRVNLAMARDRMFPGWLARIHAKLLTPYRAILCTSILALAMLALDNLEQLAKIASSLQLYSYAALNIGVVTLRIAAPDWYRPSYRAPGSPVVPVLAAVACLAIIVYSGALAQLAVLVVVTGALVFYLGWARRWVDIPNALPEVRVRFQERGVAAVLAPGIRHAIARRTELTTVRREIEVSTPRRVMVALANPEHEGDLMKLGRLIATGREHGGRVLGIHLVRVPPQTPLAVARDAFDARGPIEREIAATASLSESRPDRPTVRPVDETEVDAITDVAHDVFRALISEASARADLLLMGWRGGFNVGRIYNSPVQRIMAEAEADLAVLKDRGLADLDSVLIPWGGGTHARVGLEIAVRIADTTGATVHLLRVLTDPVDDDAIERERDHLDEVVSALGEDLPEVHHHLERGDDVTEVILAHAREHDNGLLVIGASRESRLRNVLFGSVPDVIADRAPCSVLMVRRRETEDAR